MFIINNKRRIKGYPQAQPSKNDGYKYRPQIDAQRLILETSIVSDLQNRIAYANAFFLRSFRLSLEMDVEEEEDAAASAAEKKGKTDNNNSSGMKKEVAA